VCALHAACTTWFCCLKMQRNGALAGIPRLLASLQSRIYASPTLYTVALQIMRTFATRSIALIHIATPLARSQGTNLICRLTCAGITLRVGATLANCLPHPVWPVSTVRTVPNEISATFRFGLRLSDVNAAVRCHIIFVGGLFRSCYVKSQ
jgi:hypothetical protein